MSDQRRWTLLSHQYDEGWVDSVFDGSDLAHGERIEVCPVSELDAALAERDALKAELESVSERCVNTAKDRDRWQSLYNTAARNLVNQTDALRTELAAVRAKAERLHSKLREECVASDGCDICTEGWVDLASGGPEAHYSGCPAAPDFLTQTAKEGGGR